MITLLHPFPPLESGLAILLWLIHSGFTCCVGHISFGGTVASIMQLVYVYLFSTLEKHRRAYQVWYVEGADDNLRVSADAPFTRLFVCSRSSLTKLPS